MRKQAAVDDYTLSSVIHINAATVHLRAKLVQADQVTYQDKSPFMDFFQVEHCTHRN